MTENVTKIFSLKSKKIFLGFFENRKVAPNNGKYWKKIFEKISGFLGSEKAEKYQ